MLLSGRVIHLDGDRLILEPDSSGHHVPLPIALNVAAGPVEAVNEADRNGIEAGIEDNWNGRGRHLGCKRRGDVGGSD